MSEVFKISGVGLDTSKLSYDYNLLKNYKYVHTRIQSGNESYLKHYLNDDNILITTVDFLDQIETIIPRHLSELGRDKIDLLLIDSNCKIEDNIDPINNLLISGLIGEVGISNPSIKRLEELKNSISQISSVSLDLCPLNFPYNVISYCKENDIKIIGFNPFGGRFNYPRLIESFTVPYLLSFISVYSDLVFLSTNNREVLQSETEYLLDLIGKEYGKEFNMSKDVFKLSSDFKRVVYTNLKIGDMSIPLNSPETIFSYPELSFNLGSSELVKPVEEEKDTLTQNVYDLYNSFSEGPIDNPTPENTLTLLRYRILDLARLEYPEIDGWNIFVIPISNTAFILSGVRKIIEKKLLKRSKESFEQVSYLVYYDGSDLVFQNIKNALKME